MDAAEALAEAMKQADIEIVGHVASHSLWATRAAVTMETLRKRGFDVVSVGEKA